MIDDDEEDYEGYFLRPANEYNIKEKIIQANQESFAIPTPPSPRHHGIGERRVTFREQLVDYEPDEYSSEDDGYGGGGGGGGSGSGRKRNAVIETVADVHRDADSCSPRVNSGTDHADTIIEELHLEERSGRTEEDEEGEEEVVEEEQLEYDEDDENGVGAGDRIEKHKTGVEAEPSDVVSEEDYAEEDVAEGEDILEEGTGVEGEQDDDEEEEEEEEEPTDGSSMDTEIHNPGSSEEISSSPLKTYRSEADSRSGSGDSQAEDGISAGDQQQRGDDYDDHYEDDEEEHCEHRHTRNGGECSDEEDQRPPLESHRARRSANCRRKCCRHKKSKADKLPYYNGFRSEYGLSREELEEKTRRLEARRKRVRERQQRRTAEQRQKAQSNEEAFAAWLHGKLRSSINKHQNMYDIRAHQSVGGQHSRQQQQQQLHPMQRRRNAIHAMHQISYG